jgi:hypothetical protein
MKSVETLFIALRIWLFTVVINGLMIGLYSGVWGWAFAAIIVGAIITLPIPFAANYCIKLAYRLSVSFGARIINTYFFLILLAGLFWAIFIAILGDPTANDLRLIIVLNFLSILIACFFSIGQLRKLDGVTSEETVIS